MANEGYYQDDYSNQDYGTDTTPTTPGGPSFDQVNADYMQYLGRPLTQQEYEQYWQGHPEYNASMVFNSKEGLNYYNQQNPAVSGATPPPTTTPPTGGGGTTPPPTTGGGGTGGTGGSVPGVGYTPPGGWQEFFNAPFGGAFEPPPYQQLPTAPVFTPPTFVKPPPFSAPTMQDALNEPGYQFRLNQGQRALEQSAASRGVLNTGGTLKDVLQYGQDFASNEYGNIYNRAANAYTTNYGTQYVDPYQFAYKAAYDAYTPQFNQYQNQFQATQRQNELGYTNAFNKWVQDYNMWRNQRNDVWGRYGDVLGQ